ncbi:hypothetical protein CNR22_08450 [Sphingobacteriaceae bacterium]|nr:hypothetical protein CNR22_08450 [Sphingobacteriaceae bacterium]
MDQDVKDYLEVGSFIGGVIVFTKGVWEYSAANKTKRAEFLKSLASEFDSKTYFRSKRLLDDFIVSKRPNAVIKNFIDSQIDALPCYNLKQTFRDHKTAAIVDDDELMLRREADKILDFFSRLSYYFNNGLISVKELSYFDYYLQKINYQRTNYAPHEKERLEAFKLYIALYFNPIDFERLFNHKK